jgi:hypothetical protein
MARKMFQPSKETVLNRWAFNLGPQRSVAHMLAHLGDKDLFAPFSPGDEPVWLEALAVLMSYNLQFTIDEVITELARRLKDSPKPRGMRYP